VPSIPAAPIIANVHLANKRGLSLGLYNVGLAGGNVAAFAVCAGSAHLEPTLIVQHAERDPRLFLSAMSHEPAWRLREHQDPSTESLKSVSFFDIYSRKHVGRTLTSAMIMVGIAITTMIMADVKVRPTCFLL
jgi:SP family sugar:H+ symporter-like MFS transporter